MYRTTPGHDTYTHTNVHYSMYTTSHWHAYTYYMLANTVMDTSTGAEIEHIDTTKDRAQLHN